MLLQVNYQAVAPEQILHFKMGELAL